MFIQKTDANCVFRFSWSQILYTSKNIEQYWTSINSNNISVETLKTIGDQAPHEHGAWAS